MRVLIDECVNPRVKEAFPPQDVATVTEKGWNGKANGELLALAEREFDVFVTLDRNLEYQQNTRKLRLGIVVVRVPDNKIARYQRVFRELRLAVRPGQVVQVVSPGMTG